MLRDQAGESGGAGSVWQYLAATELARLGS
jgi:hypothetical protein